MKKLVALASTLVLVLGVMMAIPASAGATIGDVGTGTDANGVYYQREWLDGNWSEFYSIGNSYWATWIEEGTPETPGTETGDYYTYVYMDDGTGSTSYEWNSILDSVTKSETWNKNANTGFYYYDLEYDATALSDPTVAYYEEKEITDDPLSGVYDYYYYRGVDFDGDHSYTDDWNYSEWKSYEPGTGEMDEGHQLYNYIDGIREYDDYDSNVLTGDYDIDRDYYKDTDLDGNWTDNYFTRYNESYDAYDGDYHKGNDIYDYDGVEHNGVATYYSYDWDENKLTGAWSETTDARFDTDGDGSWNDYDYLGANPGAYRIYKNAYYDPSEKYSWSEDSVWNALTNVYDRKYTETYEDTGYSDTWFYYRWDQDKDGSYSDDYYYYGDSYTNYYGENYQEFYSYDYLSGRYYYTYRDENTANGYLYAYTYNQYDTDGDGSWSDYSSGGAYYSYDYEYYDPSDDSYEREIVAYTPPSADGSVLFTYDYYYKETKGLYAYEETEKVIDADFDNYLWDYSGGNFGGAYYYDTYTERDPDYYDDYTSETTIYDPWSNYYQYSYSEWYPGVNGEVFYNSSHTFLYLDTDNDNDYTENYYAYAEVYSDQYSGDGYNYTENYYYDYDNGEYKYNYAESYASGQYVNKYKYAKDTDADGNIETGGSWSGSDDFWNYVETSYDADDGYTEEINWTSDDYNNSRGAYWYTSIRNETYDTGSWHKEADSANLAGSVSTSTAYDARHGYSWDEQYASTWGKDYVGSGSWSYDAGDSGTWTEKYWDTDGDTAWNNTWDYEISSRTWDDTHRDEHNVGYSLNDYDTGNSYWYEEKTSPSYFVKLWKTIDGTTGDSNDVSLLAASATSSPYTGVSEWTYGTPAPNAYEKYIYSGDAGDWYLFYYY